MRRIALLLFCLFCLLQVQAQLATIPPEGPRAQGMGGVAVISSDPWAVLNNPAGLATLDELSFFANYRTIFDFAPFNTVSAGAIIPTDFGTAGVGVFRFGDELFNSQMISLSIAKKIGIMQLGIEANYLQMNIEGFGSKGLFMAGIGGIAELTPELSFGAHIYNFTQTAISQDTGERLPTIIRLGLAYQPTTQFSLFIEGEKDVELDPDLKLGLEYQVIEEVFVRTGFSGLNNTHSFGGGVNLKKLQVNYGVQIDRDLGSSHHFGISFFPKR